MKDYLKEVTNQVEEFEADLMTKKKQLEEVSKGVHRLVRDGHITEKIRQKQPMTVEVIKALDVEIGSCDQKTRHELVFNGEVYSFFPAPIKLLCLGQQLNSGSHWQHHFTLHRFIHCTNFIFIHYVVLERR